jgi:ferredoxin-nitrite reductase
MNKMEKLKQEKHGLLVLEDIQKYASGSVEDIPEDDLMRFRWYGLFHRKREGGFMLRLRVPNGVITSAQLRGLAAAAAAYGEGNVTITTRAGVQLRRIGLGDIPAVLDRMKEIGLEVRQTGSDNIRNLMNCPLAGLQKDEAFDATSIIDEISRNIIGNRTFSSLPRKFNISVTGCYEDCAHSFLNDVGLIPQLVEGRHGFRIRIGGALGKFYAEVAEDLGVWLEKEDAVEAVMALLELFHDHGNRDNRNQARMLHMVEGMGQEELIGKLEAKLGKKLQRLEARIQAHHHHDHLGYTDQKDDSFTAAGLCVPAGRMSAQQAVELARLADEYGSGELRFTPQQNVIIPNIAKSKLDSFRAEPLLQELSPEPAPAIRGLVSCTGKEGCDLAIIDTKTPAIELAKRLDADDILPEGFRIHWSGCPNTCATSQVGDIGLRGTKTRVNGQLVDAVDIFVGGKIGHEARIGELVKEKVPVADLYDVIKGMLTMKEKPKALGDIQKAQ